MKNICKKIIAIIQIITVISIIVGTTYSYGVSTNQNARTSNSATSSKKNNSTEKNKNEEEGLASLKIEDLELTPKFNTKTYEYNVKYIGEATKLTIDAVATESYYDIEIIGNDKLEEGENLITILVSDQDEENVAIYQINVNKSLVDEEAVAKQKEAEKKQELIVKVAGGMSIGIILIIIIVAIVKAIKNRRSNYEEEYEEYDEDDEELPRALRKEHKEKGKRYK